MAWAIVRKVEEPPAGQKYFDAGGSTFHTHTCAAEGEKQHTWLCNSPYCGQLARDCPDHGGKVPITIGEEPWRS